MPLVAALVKHVLGDTCTKQELEEAVAARGKVNWSSALLAAIRAFRMGKPDIDEDDDEESLMDNDEDVQKQFEKLKERHAAAKVREQATAGEA